MTHVTITVDGVLCSDEVEPRTLLVHYLREVVGKVGTVLARSPVAKDHAERVKRVTAAVLEVVGKRP